MEEPEYDQRSIKLYFLSKHSICNLTPVDRITYLGTSTLIRTLIIFLFSMYFVLHPDYVAGDTRDIKNSLHSMSFPNCNAIWNKRNIILSDYQDWAVKQSGEVSATVHSVNDDADGRKAVEVYFKTLTKTNKRPVIVLKSDKLSSLKFNDVKAISLLLKADPNNQVRVILRDASGHTFFSKRPILAQHNKWFEIRSTNATDAVVFHGKLSGSKAHFVKKSPFTIDHIQIVLQNNNDSNGYIKFAHIGVFTPKSTNNSNNLKSPYTEWINKNCLLNLKNRIHLNLSFQSLTTPIKTNDKVPVRIVVRNNADIDSTLLVSTNRFGAQPNNSQNIILRKKISHEINDELQHSFNHPGLYAISAKIIDSKGKLLARESCKVMVWNPPGNKSQDNVPTFFGMMYHDRFTKSVQKDFKLMAEAGVRIVRFPLRWSEIQPKKNEYHWSKYDNLMKYIKFKNMIAQPMVFYTPNWASRKLENTKYSFLANKRPQWVTPNNPEDVAHFIGTAAKRYSDQPVAWEIYNEPSEIQHWIGGNSRDYINIIKAVPNTLRKVSPNAGLITAGIGITVTRNKAFADYVAHNIDGLVDGFAIHSYGGEMNAAITIETAKQMLANKTDSVSVWLNETGYLVDPSDPEGELRRSAVLAKTATISRYLGANNFTWFIFRNLSASANSATDNYALISSDGTVRPPILAYANATKWLAGAKPIQNLEIGKAIRGYEFSVGTRRLLVTWLDREHEEETFQVPHRDGMTLSGVYDVFGGAIDTRNSAKEIKQQHYPLFIIYEQKT